MSASDNKNLDILLADNADVLIDKEAEYLRQLDVSDVEISAGTDKRIRRMIKRKAWQETLRTPMLVCKRIVAVFLIVCTIGFAVCMSVQEVRAYMVSMIFQWHEKFVDVTYVTEGTPPLFIEEYREPAIQPAGTVKETLTKAQTIYIVHYRNADEGRITYLQTPIGTPESHSTSIDSENCTVEQIEIIDHEAHLFTYDDGRYTVVWHDNEYTYLMCADPYLTNRELFILMAESVYADVGQAE